MKILCIEDGSVDLDALLDKKEWRDDKVSGNKEDWEIVK